MRACAREKARSAICQRVMTHALLAEDETGGLKIFQTKAAADTQARSKISPRIVCKGVGGLYVTPLPVAKIAHFRAYELGPFVKPGAREMHRPRPHRSRRTARTARVDQKKRFPPRGFWNDREKGRFMTN